MRNLESWFNPQEKQAISAHKEEREISLEQVNLSLFTTATIDEPMTFDETWNCENEDYQSFGEKQLIRNSMK